ncbi:alpha/beta hydrolase [Paraliomyxa miuraensis]|uniref:alpha/beta hydrolase n=1 Tax=Paraliomyxa miuraensis TaxID=376150 RepID=UPI00225B52A2|nr:alpha/beta fold hydrolase [Paraliomyxa miuraensis]MCX4240418.1 lysophospholipase [Paraliomyxa miuraensis]
MSEKSTIVRFIQSLAPTASALAPTLASRWLERLFLTPMRHRPPAREQAWMASARRTTVRFDATRALPIFEWSPPTADEGTPLVLLVHGWSGRGSQLGALVAPLLERGYRVAAFDGPAHGDADGRRSALPELAIAVERVIDVLGPVHAIIAHSMGAAATTIALSRGVHVERAIYLAPPEHLGGYLYRLAKQLGFTTDVVLSVQRRIERRYGAPFDELRGSTLAPRMRVPLLVVHDQEDREVPFDEGEYIVSRWPGAALVATRGLGHRRIVRDPEVLRTVVGFVGELRPAAHVPAIGIGPNAAA